jgi:hypothetical protein
VRASVVGGPEAARNLSCGARRNLRLGRLRLREAGDALDSFELTSLFPRTSRGGGGDLIHGGSGEGLPTLDTVGSSGQACSTSRSCRRSSSSSRGRSEVMQHMGRLEWCTAGKGSPGAGGDIAFPRSRLPRRLSSLYLRHGRRACSARRRAPQPQSPRRPGEIRVQGLRTDEPPFPAVCVVLACRVPSPGCRARPWASRTSQPLLAAPLLPQVGDEKEESNEITMRRQFISFLRQPTTNAVRRR